MSSTAKNTARRPLDVGSDAHVLFLISRSASKSGRSSHTPNTKVSQPPDVSRKPVPDRPDVLEIALKTFSSKLNTVMIILDQWFTLKSSMNHILEDLV